MRVCLVRRASGCGHGSGGRKGFGKGCRGRCRVVLRKYWERACLAFRIYTAKIAHAAFDRLFGGPLLSPRGPPSRLAPRSVRVVPRPLHHSHSHPTPLETRASLSDVWSSPAMECAPSTIAPRDFNNSASSSDASGIPRCTLRRSAVNGLPGVGCCASPSWICFGGCQVRRHTAWLRHLCRQQSHPQHHR